MSIFTHEIIDGSHVITSPSGEFVGYAPSDLIARNLVNHLNGTIQNAVYTLEETGRTHQLRYHLSTDPSVGGVIASTRLTSFNPKAKSLTLLELESYFFLLTGKQK